MQNCHAGKHINIWQYMCKRWRSFGCSTSGASHRVASSEFTGVGVLPRSLRGSRDYIASRLVCLRALQNTGEREFAQLKFPVIPMFFPNQCFTKPKQVGV